MTNHTARRVAVIGAACLFVVAAQTTTVQGDELWVAPTYQQDVGGLGIGSNVIWPVTASGLVRLVWAIPDNLQNFVSAKIVLIPHGPGGPGTVNVYSCPAQHGGAVSFAACAGPFPHAFSGVTNQLVEVDVSAAVAAQIGVPGATYLAVGAYTNLAGGTDHFVGLRFTYDPVPQSRTPGNCPAGKVLTGFGTDGELICDFPRYAP